MTTLDELTEYLSLVGGAAPVRLANPDRAESTRAYVGSQQIEDARALLRAGRTAGLIQCHIGTLPDPRPGSGRPSPEIICRNAAALGIVGDEGLTACAFDAEWLNTWLLLKEADGSVIILTDPGWTHAALMRYRRGGAPARSHPQALPVPISEAALPQAHLDDLFSGRLYYAFSGAEDTPAGEAGTAQRVIYGTTEILLTYDVDDGGPPVHMTCADHDPCLATLWQSAATRTGADDATSANARGADATPWRFIQRPVHYAEAETAPEAIRGGTVQLANGQHLRPEVVRFVQDHYPEATWLGTAPKGHPCHDSSALIAIRSQGRLVCLLAPIPPACLQSRQRPGQPAGAERPAHREPTHAGSAHAGAIPSVRRITARELEALQGQPGYDSHPNDAQPSDVQPSDGRPAPRAA